MKLRKLRYSDRKIFEQYLGLSPHALSVYSFTNIYIWKGLFEIYWKIIQDSLCVFFKDKLSCFLYLSPLAKQLKPESVGKVFEVMDGFNAHQEVSRIENVEEQDLEFYRYAGYACRQKSVDYFYLLEELTQLEGNNFKSKRWSVNYFLKHYQFEYLPYAEKYHQDCLRLYQLWAKQRRQEFGGSLYQGMLEDSFSTLKMLLSDFRFLNCIGRVIKIDQEVKGFSFGCRLNPDTFSILYETTDLSIKGLAQFIFREFCAELKDYRYINIMDDSGLENLKKVKLSYRPLKLIPAYIIKRDDA